VMKMISMAIQGARRNKRHSGLCGQAPSDYPEFAEFLVREGIESISLTPDAVMKVTLNLLDVEKKMGLLTEAMQITDVRGVGALRPH
jgi:pyruvate,water dikinase